MAQFFFQPFIALQIFTVVIWTHWIIALLIHYSETTAVKLFIVLFSGAIIGKTNKTVVLPMIWYKKMLQRRQRIRSLYWRDHNARPYLQLMLGQLGTANVYLIVLSSWEVNIAENPIAVIMGIRNTHGCNGIVDMFG